ncbi:MAG: hypothetical protein R2800_08695 [Flavipsychrobacter sp.]
MKRLILLILPTMLLAACGNTGAEQDTNIDAEQTEEMTSVTHAEDEYGMSYEEYETLKAQLAPPKRGQLVDGTWEIGEDELDYVLTLKSISDGAYPSFSIEALPRDQDKPVWFYLNAEDYKGATINELMSSIGKPARIVYYIRQQNRMTGTVDNTHQTDKVALELQEGEKSITGKWIAEEVSNGDLPDDIYIETANGLKVPFPAFITEEDVAMNGKNVTVNYTTDEDMVVSYIKLMND